MNANLTKNYDYNKILSTPKKVKKISKRKSLENSDYNQVYGEPPPPYKFAKYLPNAISGDVQSNKIFFPDTTIPTDQDNSCIFITQNAHIYDYIDENFKNEIILSNNEKLKELSTSL